MTSNPDVAIVDERGQVTGISPGEAEITAISQGNPELSSKTNVNVVGEPVTTPVAVVMDMVRLYMVKDGATATLRARVLPEDATNKKISWSSNKPDVADIDPATGEITPGVPGVATITVTTDEGYRRAYCQVRVSAEAIPIENFYAGPVLMTLEKDGPTGTIIANIIPGGTDNQQIRWASTNPGVATVEEDETDGVFVNKVIPGNPGTAIINILLSGTEEFYSQVMVRVRDVWSKTLLKTEERQKTWRILFSHELSETETAAGLAGKVRLFDENDGLVPGVVEIDENDRRKLGVTPRNNLAPGKYYILISEDIESVDGDTLVEDMRAWFEVE